MSGNYFPANDEHLRTWLMNFATVLGNNLAQVGLVAADVAPLDADLVDFDMALTNYLSQKTLMTSASNQKKETRAEAIETLRPLVRRIQEHPGMTDALRGLLGLPERGGGNIPLGETPVTLLTPVLLLEPGVGQVIVHWGPNPKNERNNGKPAGVKSANIYRKQAGESSYQLVGTATKSPYLDPVTGPGTDYIYVVRYRGTNPLDLSNESEAAAVAARGEVAA